MICFAALWGTLLPPTVENYVRWCRYKYVDEEIKRAYNAYQSPQNWEGRDVENSPIDFINFIDKNDDYVFISNLQQDIGLQEALTKFDLHKYIKYKSPLITNPTHPLDGPCLTVYVFNFKEYK